MFVPVFLTCNTLPRNDELGQTAFLEAAQAAGVNASVVAMTQSHEFGVKQYAPAKGGDHISTQAGIVKHAMANALYDMGEQNIVLAELSLDDIAQIRAKAPADLEMKTFVRCYVHHVLFRPLLIVSI